MALVSAPSPTDEEHTDANTYPTPSYDQQTPSIWHDYIMRMSLPTLSSWKDPYMVLCF